MRENRIPLDADMGNHRRITQADIDRQTVEEHGPASAPARTQKAPTSSRDYIRDLNPDTEEREA